MSDSGVVVEHRDLIRTSAITAVWSVSIGIILCAFPVILVWTLGASGAGSLGNAIKAALLAWPIAHGARVSVTGVSIDVMPFLLALFPIFLLRRAAMRIFKIVEPSSKVILSVLTPIVSVNFLISATLAWLASDDVISVYPLWVFPPVFIVGTVAVLSAAVKVYGYPLINFEEFKFLIGVRVGGYLVAGLLLAAAVLSSVRLVLSFDQAKLVVASVADTNYEILLVWLTTIGFAPVAIAWGYAWLLGSGVSTSIDTASSFAVVDEVAYPAIPWLAALPTDVISNAWLILLVPFVLSSIAAILLWWSLHNSKLSEIIMNSSVALLLVLVATLILSLLGGGSAGPGRLAVFGPQWLPMLGGVFVSIAPAFMVMLLVEFLRRKLKIRKLAKHER